MYGIFSDNTFRRFNLAYAETRNTTPPGGLKLGNLLSLDYNELNAYALIQNGVGDRRILELDLKTNSANVATQAQSFAPGVGFLNVNSSTTVNFYDNKLYFTNGQKSERFEDKILFLSNDYKKVLLWDLTNSITLTAFQSQTKIEDFTVDFDSNIWLMFNNDCYAKYTLERGFVLSGTFSDKTYNNYKIDVAAEFSDGDYNQYIVATRQTSTTNKYINFVKLDLNGNEFDSTIFKSNTAVNNNLTNSNFLRSFIKSKYPKTNLNVKTKLVNVYNLNDTTEAEIIFNLSALDTGYHNFAVRFDADFGTMQLFVDGQPQQGISFKPRKYKFSNLFLRPFLIGSSNYSFSVPLFSYLKNKSFLVDDFKIKNFYLYSTPLNDYDIIMHARKGMQIRDINFDVACGQRNYIEEIERYFKLNIPASKSTLYNITIRNSGITNKSLQDELEKRILTLLRNSVPAYTKLNKIKWSN